MFSHVNMILSFPLNCSWDNICKAKGNSDLAWSYEVRSVWVSSWLISQWFWVTASILCASRHKWIVCFCIRSVFFWSTDTRFVFCFLAGVNARARERRKNIFSCSLVLRAFWILPVELKKTVKIINPVFKRDEFTFRGPASSLKRRGTDERERWKQAGSHTRDAFNKEKQRDGSLCWAHLVF